MIDHLNAIVLPVRDVKACAHFYRDKLGLELTELHEEDAYLTIGGGSPVLALKSLALSAREISEGRIKPDEDPVKRTQLVVFVGDVDAEYADLLGKGVRFVKAPTTQEGGWRTAHFEDPEGNLWEVSQRPKR